MPFYVVGRSLPPSAAHICMDPIDTELYTQISIWQGKRFRKEGIYGGVYIHATEYRCCRNALVQAYSPQVTKMMASHDQSSKHLICNRDFILWLKKPHSGHSDSMCTSITSIDTL